VKFYLDGPACVGHQVELPDGRVGWAHSIAGPGTLWVLVEPSDNGPASYEAHNEANLKPFEED
jgi:hypothetical protein